MANPTAPAPQVPSNPTTSAPNPPTPGGVTHPPTPTEMRKLKLKLDGQDVEMPESEVIALAQQGKASGKRFQEAAALKKQAEEVMRFAKENPTEFFKKTGMNAREWAENYLIEELKSEAMTPQEKKAAQNEAKLKEYEDEKKRAVEQQRLDEEAKIQAHHHEAYEKLFIEALGKSGLPRTPYTVRRMAELQLTNIKKNLELSADQLAKIVREDYIAEQKALFGSSEGEQLLEIFGPDIVKKLSKAQLAKLKAKNVPGAASDTTPKKGKGEPPLTWRAWQLRNRGRG